MPELEAATIKIDEDAISVYGIKYSLELFKFLGLSMPGEYFRLVDNKDGMVTVKRYVTNEDAYKEANATLAASDKE